MPSLLVYNTFFTLHKTVHSLPWSNSLLCYWRPFFISIVTYMIVQCQHRHKGPATCLLLFLTDNLGFVKHACPPISLIFFKFDEWAIPLMCMVLHKCIGHKRNKVIKKVVVSPMN